MPAGVSVGQYLRFAFAALASMALGSQTVHYMYDPLKDFDKYVDEEMKKFPEDLRQQIIQKSEKNAKQMKELLNRAECTR